MILKDFPNSSTDSMYSLFFPLFLILTEDGKRQAADYFQDACLNLDSHLPPYHLQEANKRRQVVRKRMQSKWKDKLDQVLSFSLIAREQAA